MKYLKILIFCAFAAMSVSCSITRNGSYAPVTSQLNLQMDDLEYLGETEISVEYRTYLGFIRVIDKVNGQKFDSGNRQLATMNAGTSNSPKVSGTLKKATYKVLEEFPEANYFIMVRTRRDISRLFLGSDKIDKAVIKAYAIKN